MYYAPLHIVLGLVLFSIYFVRYVVLPTFVGEQRCVIHLTIIILPHYEE